MSAYPPTPPEYPPPPPEKFLNPGRLATRACYNPSEPARGYPIGHRRGTMTRDKRPAMGLALLASAVLILLIALGSRGFADFDSALIGYAVGTVFAVAAVTYRYALWVTTRPPTRRYFRAGWASFLSWDNFRRYTTLVPAALWRDILA